MLLIGLALLASGQVPRAQADAVNTLDALFAKLGQCWQPPQPSDSQGSFTITVMFALKRDGTLLGRPKVTFETPGAPEDRRIAYRIAVKEMLDRCTPVRITEALGNAIAGRPFRMRLNDRRNLIQPSERKA